MAKQEKGTLELLLTELNQETQQLLQNCPETENCPETGSAELLDSLSPRARGVVQTLTTKEEADLDDFEKTKEPGWFVVVCPDGEAPRLNSCDSAEEVSYLLTELCEQDVFAFPFFGIVQGFSTHPQRFLRTHEGKVYPLFDTHNAEIVTDEVELEIQGDFFLGTPDISITPAAFPRILRTEEEDEDDYDEEYEEESEEYYESSYVSDGDMHD